MKKSRSWNHTALPLALLAVLDLTSSPDRSALNYDEKPGLDAPTKTVWYRRKLFGILGALLGLIVVLAVAAARSHHSASTAASAPPASAWSHLPSIVANVPTGSSAPGPLTSVAGQTSVRHGGVCP